MQQVMECKICNNIIECKFQFDKLTGERVIICPNCQTRYLRCGGNPVDITSEPDKIKIVWR